MAAAVDPLLAKLNEWYAGVGRERDKMELWGILRSLADSHARGEVTDVELSAYVSELAEVAAAHLAAAGRALNVEEAADELLKLVKQSSASSTYARYAKIIERLREARMKAAERREAGGIL